MNLQNYPIALALRGVSKCFDRPAVDALDLTGGHGVDYALDAVGTSATAEVAVGATRQGGTCVIIGRADATVNASIATSHFCAPEPTLKWRWKICSVPVH